MQHDATEARRELFHRLLEEQGDKIYSFALSLTGNETEAQDLTAEAFAKALRSFDRYDVSKPFHSWVFKILQNIHIDRKRLLETRSTVSMEDVLPKDEDGRRMPEQWASGEPAPDRGMEQEEMTRSVHRALADVPEVFREPLVLADMLAMSYEQIAGTLRVPVGTVRSRIFRGRQLFRERIRPYVEKGGLP